MGKTKKEITKKDGKSVEILGVSLNSTSTSSVLKQIVQRTERNKKTFIVTPNPEFLVFAQKNPWFRNILNKADVAIPDGIGLVWVSRFLAFRPLTTLFSLMSARRSKKSPEISGDFGADSLKKAASRPKAPRMVARQRPRLLRGGIIRGRISGTDFMEKLCQEAAKRGWSVYLLGGQPGVAKKTLEVLKKRYPGLRGWAEAGPKLEIRNWKLEITEKWVKRINQKKPTFLFAAFGMGKQEKFIWDHWDQLKVKLAMGVGGAFDYLSGTVPRAPKWMRKIGLEWLYRLIREPWRWKRQLALAEFIFLVLKEKSARAEK